MESWQDGTVAASLINNLIVYDLRELKSMVYHTYRYKQVTKNCVVSGRYPLVSKLRK